MGRGSLWPPVLFLLMRKSLSPSGRFSPQTAHEQIHRGSLQHLSDSNLLPKGKSEYLTVFTWTTLAVEPPTVSTHTTFWTSLESMIPCDNQQQREYICPHLLININNDQIQIDLRDMIYFTMHDSGQAWLMNLLDYISTSEHTASLYGSTQCAELKQSELSTVDGSIYTSF